MIRDKLKVGLDLDGVIYDFATPFDRMMLGLGLEPKYSEYDRGLRKEDLSKILKTMGKTKPFLWLQSYPGAIEKIKELSKCMDFYIITNRSWYKDAEKDTLFRLKQDMIPYKEIVFSPDKAKYAKEFNLEYFFEDNLDNARQIAKDKDKCVLLINHEYNQGNLEKNILRIKSLEALR